MAQIDRPTLDDPKDSWLVYADALQAAGDPRGELIVLNQAIEDGAGSADRDALLDRHAEALFGGLAPHREQVEVAWKWSIPRSVTLKIGPKDQPEALLDALLSSPLAADMQELRLVARTPSDSDRVALGSTLARLSEALPTNCRSLELIDERAQRARILVSADYDPGDNLVDFGDLDAVWAIPQLERLHLVVADAEQVKLGTIDAPNLQDFALLGLRWSSPYDAPSPMARTLAAAKWPKLRSLALRIPETFTYSWPDQHGAYVRTERYDEDNEYYDEYMDDDGWREDFNWSAELGGLLTALKSTPIERLSLISFASSPTLLAALADHGLPPTLRTLDLSQSDLDGESVAWMLDHRALFDQLELLDLTGTLIDDAGPLAELKPRVEHSSGGGAIYRFSVGME